MLRNPPTLTIPQPVSPDKPLGILVLPAIGTGPLPRRTVPASAHLLAVGIVYSEGPYPSLGLKRDFNCLILAWDAGTNPVKYAAWMVWVGKNETRCAQDPLTLDPSQATPLHVAAIASLRSDSVPPVARWDWDDSRAFGQLRRQS